MDHSMEELAKELLKDGHAQAKVVLLALALYEIAVLGKKAWGLIKEIKV